MKTKYLSKLRTILVFSMLSIYLASCATGATLRTARTLEKGECEFSAGIVYNSFNLSEVIVAAYGLTDNIDIEARWEDRSIMFTPRFQLLRSEQSLLDCLTFLELGYNKYSSFQIGPGIMIGKRWNFVEPYLSYRFRHYTAPSKSERDVFWKDIESYNYHFIKIGTRVYIPCFWNAENEAVQNMKWFIGLEAGPTIRSDGTIAEGAINFGFDY